MRFGSPSARFQGVIMNAKEPHEVLGIPATAGIAEIRQAYRQMALKWHPDRHVHDEDRNYLMNRFAEVTSAYQALIRGIDAPPSGTAKSKLRTRVPTPIPSVKESSTGSPTSTTSSWDSQLFSSLRSPGDSQITLRSSFRGSIKAPKAEASNRKLQHLFDKRISISNKQISLQATNESLIPEVDSKPPRTTSFRPSPSRIADNEQSVGGLWHRHVERSTPSSSHPIRLPMAISQLNLEGDSRIRKSGPPLRSLGLGPSGEWAYSLVLTLEELFSGRHCSFCVVRHLLSGRSKNVIIEIDIPSGCQRGTRILCRGVGHELPNGKLQDVAFVVEEALHTRYSRMQDDLFVDLQLPWTRSLEQRPKQVHIRGIDGEEISFFIDYVRDTTLKGDLSIRGAGMPIRNGGRVCGRGNLVVQWEILPPQPRSTTMRNSSQALHPSLSHNVQRDPRISLPI
ncbi:putative protein folding [Lyophyllum shimeji]|uniref:J domain-containing protein n=1 Tax=Lyophyllum shimeji TaxID=47721 RepID=A0A9P3UPI1_LYOSH|nr:putative protein folding [Lyophyllum shimeji]